ncbi:MFS transporter [Kitasatospora sp. NPDC057198]|uniref:MFS transporter n=1 Tax=Kitasatospora sp. NPDC057198 TaxID=3346046 RepID=UPI003632358E
MKKPPGERLRWNRDFALLWSGQALSQLGTQMDVIAYPLLVLAITGSPSWAGVVGFAQTIPFLLFALPAGALVDRWDRRRVMIFSDGTRCLLLTFLVVAIATGWVGLPLVVAVAFAEAVLGIFFNIAGQGAVRSLVPKEFLGVAAARLQARDATAALVGGPVGGALFGVHRVLPFVGDALSYLFGAVSTLLIKQPFQETARTKPESIVAAVKAGLRFAWREPFIRASALMGGAANTIGSAVVLLSIIIAKENGSSPTSIGALSALIGLGGILGALAVPVLQRRLSKTAIFVGVGWWWVLLIPLMAFTGNPYLLGLIGAALTFPFSTWNAVAFARVVGLTPDGIFGRVQSVNQLISRAMTPLGPLGAGIGYAILGPIPTVLVLVALTLIMALGGTMSRGLRQIKAEDAEEVEEATPTLAR